MRTSRFNSLKQLAGVMAGFILAIVLLESEGLFLWAQRLEIGHGRKVALQVTSNLHVRLQPLRVEWLRRQGLAELAELGWSDDPAQLQRIGKRVDSSIPNLTHNRAELYLSGSSSPLSGLATTKGKSTTPALRGTDSPLIPNVPKLTALPPLPQITTSNPRVVALVGDSMMAVGLSNVMLRETAGNKNLRVIKAFRSGTGLARPEVFDWTTEYPAMIGNEQPDIIFVAIGANDGQGFVVQDKVLDFGSDAWIKVYQQRTAVFLNLLTQNGARVVWVGLPPMKSEKYNERIALINRIAYTVISQYPQASWWNPLPYLGDETGSYREFVMLDSGKTVRIRATDGIHMSDEGAELLVPTFVDWLATSMPPAQAQMTAPEKSPTTNQPGSKSHGR